jgi:uroporphyrin-3 C-methyltransferase/uroporphyrinogen III methyltransferase/synthase
MLADVESSVMIAAQQLQLGGNVNSALLAMQDAEQVLARSNQPSMIGLRRVLTRDIERLKSVPLADFAAAVNRLDAVIGMVEQMPLLADLQAAGAGAPAARGGEPPAAGLRGLPERVARTGLQGWDAFVAELRSLFRVQRVEQPEALLLSPDQRFLARETLRLQLLNARLNLLARNDALFRGDLARATGAIDKWFDPQHKTVVAAQAALRQLQATRLAIDLPSLAESIGAVRAARAASDAR